MLAPPVFGVCGLNERPLKLAGSPACAVEMSPDIRGGMFAIGGVDGVPCLPVPGRDVGVPIRTAGLPDIPCTLSSPVRLGPDMSTGRDGFDDIGTQEDERAKQR